MASSTAGALGVRNPVNRLTRVASAGGGGSDAASGGGGTPFGRTPTFLRPLEDDEHASVQELVKGVVQIFAHTVANDWKRPWGKASPAASSGTGFIISVSQRLIVTNAHCTTDAMTLQVRKDGDFDKEVATVLACSHQADICIITVASDAFWRGAIALPLGDTPRLQQHIDVVGFPMGGDGISITSGVVSRVDWGEYSHSSCSNLIVTVDAAINAGNSGGPAISNGQVVGVAFQGLKEGENIGYIIPAKVLLLVLEDFAANKGSLVGFAHLNASFSGLESAAKRAWLGLPEGASGVYIRSVENLSALGGLLREGDVLTAVEGKPVSNDGRVQYGSGSPIDARVLVTLKLVGSPLRLSVFRAGAQLEIATSAEAEIELVPSNWFRDSSYCFFAGLVFLPIARGTTDSYFYTQVLWEGQGLKHVHAEQQVVGLGSILPHSCTLGYTGGDFRHEPLLSINGEAVLCLADVLRLTRSATGAFVVFSFAKAKKMVLALGAAREATASLMRAHGVAAEASADVVAAAAREPLQARLAAAGGGGAAGGAGATGATGSD